MITFGGGRIGGEGGRGGGKNVGGGLGERNDPNRAKRCHAIYGMLFRQ